MLEWLKSWFAPQGADADDADRLVRRAALRGADLHVCEAVRLLRDEYRRTYDFEDLYDEETAELLNQAEQLSEALEEALDRA